MNEYIVICTISITLGVIGILDRIINHQNYKTSTNQITNIYNYTIPIMSICLIIGGVVGFVCLFVY